MKRRDPRQSFPAPDFSGLRLEAVSLAHGEAVPVLEDVTAEIEEGKLTTVIGPSGCGKTTLLKIIAGLITPTSGRITFAGEEITRPGPDRAFVFQDFALLPWANVLDNVAFGLALRGTRRHRRHEIARRYLAKVGLEGCETALPGELSGGMRQRVGLARALAVNARVLLMDEPFSAVDEQTRRKFQEDLLGLAEIGQKTIVFVTHSIEEAVYVSDRIILLTPRPARVFGIFEPMLPRQAGPEAVRRHPRYLDSVDEIWRILKRHVQ